MSVDYIVDDNPIIKSSKACSLDVTGLGILRGLEICDENGKSKTRRYTGIRYAEAPIGRRRWTKPKNLPSEYDYSGDYTKFGASCPQITDGQPTHRMYNEDCLFLNIWIPVDSAPSSGWPVLFYIHGGWLQGGTALDTRHADPQDIQSEEHLEHFIVVAPTYRLNIFGFLSMDELLEENDRCNFGLWDIRTALEWTDKHISKFGGNPDNITVGGVSAGAYAALCQVAYEVYHEDSKQIIRRVFLESNAISFQPKTTSENHAQVQELLKYLNIDEKQNSEEIVNCLRKTSVDQLMDIIPKLQQSMFRPVTDDDFISKTFARDIYSGVFGQKIAQSGRSVLIGEVDNELAGYRDNGAPEKTDELSLRLRNMYPDKIVDALLEIYPVPEIQDDPVKDLDRIKDLFGEIVSDMQVHVAERLLIRSLIKGGVPLDRILRYKIDYRAKYVDKYIPPDMRVPHGSDTMIWFYPAQCGIQPDEKRKYIIWLKPYIEWLTSGVTAWGTSSVMEYKKFSHDGNVEIEFDDRWKWSETVISKLENSL